MGPGRPLKFKSVSALQKAIDAYFESCWEPVMDRKLKADAKKIRGKYKEDDYEWAQRRDWRGEPIFQQIRPYTITGLAMALNTSRQTLVNYEEREDYFDAIKAAKLRCENYVEEKLLSGDVPPAPGIFNLKNNYDWKDEQHSIHDVAGTLADLLREPNDKPQRGKPKKAIPGRPA